MNWSGLVGSVSLEQHGAQTMKSKGARMVRAVLVPGTFQWREFQLCVGTQGWRGARHFQGKRHWRAFLFSEMDDFGLHRVLKELSCHVIWVLLPQTFIPRVLSACAVLGTGQHGPQGGSHSAPRAGSFPHPL